MHLSPLILAPPLPSPPLYYPHLPSSRLPPHPSSLLPTSHLPNPNFKHISKFLDSLSDRSILTFMHSHSFLLRLDYLLFKPCIIVLFRNGARDAVGTEVYPGCDGKVCLPEADLCANRKNKVEQYFMNHDYQHPDPDTRT